MEKEIDKVSNSGINEEQLSIYKDTIAITDKDNSKILNKQDNITTYELIGKENKKV